MANENDDIIIGNEGLNIDQSADDGEIGELDRGLSGEGDADAGRGAGEGATGEGSEEVDLDDLEEEERSARVDNELQEAHTQEERDRIKSDRKQRANDRRARARQRVESLQREIANERQLRTNLEQRLYSLEGHQTGLQFSQLEEAETRAEQAIAQLEDIIADATVKADGRTVAQANTRLQEALLYKRDVQVAKQQFQQRASAPKQQHLDPEMVRRSKGWVAKNQWFRGPGAKDPDSMVMISIDNSLASDGFNPSTDAYWDELEARVKKYLPHRAQGRAMAANSEDNSRNNGAQPARGQQTGRPRQAVAGAGNTGNSPPGGRNTFTLSAERVKAMKESGAWEDPKRKADQIRRYREYDAQNQR